MTQSQNLWEVVEPCCYAEDDCEDVAVWDIYDGTDPYGPGACACDKHLGDLLSPAVENVVVLREEWRTRLGGEDG